MNTAVLRVAVDGWNLPHDRRGIGRYVRAILCSWQRTAADRVAPTLVIPERPAWFHASRYRAALASGDIPIVHRDAVRRDLFDVAWFPWNGMSWTVDGVASVATLHDASLFALPPPDEAIARREQAIFRVAAERARRIITDSSFSKSELERYLGLESAKIEVVHLGVEPVAAVEPARFDRFKRYVLIVGEPERRKGVDLLIAAAARLTAPARAGLGIVLAGSGTLELSDQKAVPPTIGLGSVSDARLAALYAGATVLVYPSRYEGFGLPVLEAMAAGTPVIASDAGAIPEAGGDAALYFPSGDADALANTLQRVLDDPELRGDLRDRGLRRAAGMTWDRAAAATLAVLKNVARSD